MTSRVSTRTSRSELSATSGAALGAPGLGFGTSLRDASSPGCSALPRAAPAPGLVVELVPAGLLPGRGLGTGFTNTACHTYSTRNARKMARRTRLSIRTAQGHDPRRRAVDSELGVWLRAIHREAHRDARSPRRHSP